MNKDTRTPIPVPTHSVLQPRALGEIKVRQRKRAAEGRGDSDDGVGQAQLDVLGATGDLVAVPDGGVNARRERLALLGRQLTVEGAEVHEAEQYPKVMRSAIPLGQSPSSTQGYKIPSAMESELPLTNEQLLLMEVRDKLCGGNAAELARRIGKDATYVNRLFYPAGKAGRKGIGLGIMRAVIDAFDLPAGFWSLQPPAIPDQLAARITTKMVLRAAGATHGRPRTLDFPNSTAQEPRASFGMEPILAWEHPDDLPPGEFVMIPRLDVRLSAGHGCDQVEIELTKENPQAFRTEWIRQQRLKPNRLAAMRASGDSMEPTIHNGDSLLVDTSQVDVLDGRVYALWYDGGERVKRLFRLPGGGLRIKSDNTSFDPIELGADYPGQVRVIGRVVHRSGIGGL
jgi:phage repressor protein C with HTH and peptisase S24 domain